MTNASQLDYKMLTPAEASPEAKALLDATHGKIGMIPNMYSVMANSPAFLDSYMHSYEAFRNQSGFSPIEQEVTFLAISAENGCEYCVSAHSFVADVMSNVPTEVTDAIRDGRDIPDAQLQALATMAKVIVSKRGLPSTQDVSDFLNAGYTQNDLLSVILAVSVKTLSNYINHIAKTPVDAAFAGRVWAKAS